MEQFHSYKQKPFLSASLRVKTSDKLRLAIFTLPITTEQSTVCHLRGPMRLEWLRLFIVSENILGAQVAQDWESPSLPPPNPPHDRS